MKQISFDIWLAGRSYDRAWSCLSVQEVAAVSLLRRNHSVNEDIRSCSVYVTALIWQRRWVCMETGTKHCRHAAANLPCASSLSLSSTDWKEMKSRRKREGAGCSRASVQLSLCVRPRCLPPSSAAARQAEVASRACGPESGMGQLHRT